MLSGIKIFLFRFVAFQPLTKVININLMNKRKAMYFFCVALYWIVVFYRCVLYHILMLKISKTNLYRQLEMGFVGILPQSDALLSPTE